MQLDLVTLVVDEYDPAIDFFVDVLGFVLVEDEPSLTNDGRPKRWVVVRPPHGGTGLLLARADGERQTAVVGQQVAGRVGFFLRVDDFDRAYERMCGAGVEFVTEPRVESYGRVAVFLDIAGNRWDLLGPPGDAGGQRRAPESNAARSANPVTNICSINRWTLSAASRTVVHVFDRTHVRPPLLPRRHR